MTPTDICDRIPRGHEPQTILTVLDPQGNKGHIRLTPEAGTDRGEVYLAMWKASCTLFTWVGDKIIWPPDVVDNRARLRLISSLTFLQLSGWDEDPFDLGRATT